MTLPTMGSGRHTAALRGPARETWARFFRNRSMIAGLVLLAPVLAISLVLPAFYPVDPFEIVWAPLAPPGAGPGIPLGSDLVGRDILAGIVHGGRATLAVGASAAAIAVVLGIGIGAAAGFYGGLVNESLMRLTEFFQTLPALLFAMVVVSLFGPAFPQSPPPSASSAGRRSPVSPEPSSSGSASSTTSPHPAPSAPRTGA